MRVLRKFKSFKQGQPRKSHFSVRRKHSSVIVPINLRASEIMQLQELLRGALLKRQDAQIKTAVHEQKRGLWDHEDARDAEQRQLNHMSSCVKQTGEKAGVWF